MKYTVLIIPIVLLSLLLTGCPATTTAPRATSCEDRFDRALERGTPYTEALGNYTQCLIDRGDTIGTNAFKRLARDVASH